MRKNAIGTLVVTLTLLLGAMPGMTWGETSPKFYAVEVSATIQASPAQITLSWPADPRATAYKIFRKSPGASQWNALTSLPGGSVSFTDEAVSSGVAYEYQISKSTSAGYQGYGYISAGIRAPAAERRGKLVLIVDDTYAGELAAELSRLEQDLIGDGWTVLRHDVSRNDSPARVKSLIQSEYRSDPANVRTVFLFGHVPVPYSGDLHPDRHGDHKGAWPADVYYGDMDGNWTDASVHDTSAERQRNWNVPGDGKFDQSDLPSDVELEVGRVDLANMTCFANKTPARSEKDLLRQYLAKDHNFRHRLIQVERRGLICDSFGEKSGEAFAASGWRNFAPFFGASKVYEVPGGSYFSTVGSQSYLWSYGAGGGSFYTCNGIGSSDDFARTDIQSVFTMFLGSYFGDWDNESNFLRAPLGSTTYGLAAAWAGRPHWFFHHMGLGETIGYGTRLSQNNTSSGPYAAPNYGTRMVHVALMGDPTLRLHPVAPPSSFNAALSSSGVSLTWAASPDQNIEGYHVYRAASPKGPFTRITGEAPIQATSFHDASGAGLHTYMVRAIKLELCPSGSYLNPSQGIFSSPGGEGAGSSPITSTPAPSPVPQSGTAQAAFVKLDATTSGNWKGSYGTEGYQIMRDAVNYPNYAVVTSNGKSEYVWNESTGDSRALQKAGGSDRIASCWYADPGFSAEVNFVDGKSHRLALYCLDWDTTSRAQTVELLDAASGALLDRRAISGFNRGVYLVWDVKGRIAIRFSKTAGNNAVLMGLFFDPAGSALADTQRSLAVVPNAAAALPSGRFQLRISGEVGQRFAVEVSTNCVNWSKAGEVTLQNQTFDFVDSEAAKFSTRFYRAVRLP